MRKRLYPDNPDWTYESIVQSEGVGFYNEYYYKEEKVHRINIDTPMAKQFAGYTLIEKDLRNCKIWLEEILKLVKDDERYKNASGNIVNDSNREIFNLVKGLFVAALTIYGKCFTRCEGRRAKLEKRNLEEKYHDEHEDAMSFRHNFAAHSGAKKLEFARLVLLLYPKKMQANALHLSTELLQPDAFGIEDIQKFIDLCNHAREYCMNKCETLEKKIYKEDVIKKGPSYWYKKVGE